MSIGLGKRYWVHVIRHHFGKLEDCLKYMNEHKPRNIYQWYELRPYVRVRDEGTYCEEYMCDLVEEAK